MISKALDYKKILFRKLKYWVRRPTPPCHPEPIAGPVLVIGSAPVSHLPEGFDDRFCVISVNGSQDIARKWGIDKPHVTFMQYNQIEGTNTNAVAVRSVLNGKNTGRLYVLLWRDGLDKLKRGLSAFDYTCDHLQIVSRYERIALHHSVMRSWNFEDDIDMRFSNGVTAVLYAIQSGAKTVIISGINPNSTGHAYNDANLPRSHVDRDRDILMKIHENGFPLFTADPTVAKTLGLPLWTREAADCLNVTGTK